MKISRLNFLSTLCFFISFIFIIVFYIVDYNSNNNKELVFVNNDELASENVVINEIDISLEEDNNIDEDIVYDNMTLDELASKLDNTLNSTLSGKGYLYASYSLERGVDPYLAVAISMEETGCAWTCSTLVTSCNNVGGMKGYGCGSYGYFDTLDDGIMAFIDNIANNYVAYGLTNAELMNSKYAENTSWAANVNAYIEKIKNN